MFHHGSPQKSLFCFVCRHAFGGETQQVGSGFLRLLVLSSLLSAAAFAFWNPSGRKTLGINVIDMALDVSHADDSGFFFATTAYVFPIFLAETLVKTVPFSKGWTCGDGVGPCFPPRLEVALWGPRLFEAISTGTWKHTPKTPKQKHKNAGVSMKFTHLAFLVSGGSVTKM